MQQLSGSQSFHQGLPQTSQRDGKYLFTSQEISEEEPSNPFRLCQQVMDALFSADEEDLSASITEEKFKQEDSASSEEEMHGHPKSGGQFFHATGSDNRGIASVLDPENF